MIITMKDVLNHAGIKTSGSVEWLLEMCDKFVTCMGTVNKKIKFDVCYDTDTVTKKEYTAPIPDEWRISTPSNLIGYLIDAFEDMDYYDGTGDLHFEREGDELLIFEPTVDEDQTDEPIAKITNFQWASDKTFIPGVKYYSRSIGDQNCIFEITVISRTEKSLSYSYGNRTRRSKIHTDENGEYIRPDNYSMAPVFRAHRILY